MTEPPRSTNEPGAPAILRDGRSVTVRPIAAGDAEDLLALFESLSDPTIYPRYFSPTGGREGPSLAAAAALCRPGPDEMRLVVVADDEGVRRVVGVGQCARDTVRPTRGSLTLAVHDAWQNRGVGTLLLERLAVAAQAGGIREFEGFALREDRRILEVLRASGLRGTRSIEGGRVRVELSTEETSEFRRASIEREMEATARSLEPFFAARAIAVIGASRRPGSIGGILVDNLAKAGFPGRVIPVNPVADRIGGFQAYPSIEAAPGPIDVALIAVHVPDVEDTVRQCIRKGVRGVVIITSGFAEVDDAGRAAEERITGIVRAAGLRLIGPNCMGYISTDPRRPIYGTFASCYPPAGNIALLSQSGGLGAAILDYVAAHGLGVSQLVSIGNRADVSVNDLLCFWADDERTDVIALYLESFGNPEKFAQIAPRIARRKPIVAVKSGRTAAGVRAASSHSASLASVDVGVDAVFDQAGVIRTNTLEELFDVARVLSSQPLPTGARVGVITNAGGAGVLLADALEVRGFQLPALAEPTLERLKAALPFQAGLANPIDMLGYADGSLYEHAMELVGADPSVDAVIASYVPPLVTHPQEVAAGIARGAGKVPPGKPVLTVFLSSSAQAPEELHAGARGRLPVFMFPENAAQALWSIERYARWRERPRGEPFQAAEDTRQRVRALIDQVLAENSAAQWLSADRVGALLETMGIPVAASRLVQREDVPAAAAAIGYPVVLKAVSPDVLHKSDAGGVVLDIEDEADLARALEAVTAAMRARQARVEGYLVQRQVRGGLEFLVGVTLDPAFGHLVLAGLGGIHVEVLKDVSFCLPPVTDVDALEMLGRLRASPLLDGFRGAPRADRAALVDVLTRVSALVELMPEIVEMDLNPVKVLPEGEGAVVVDARVRVEAR